MSKRSAFNRSAERKPWCFEPAAIATQPRDPKTLQPRSGGMGKPGTEVPGGSECNRKRSPAGTAQHALNAIRTPETISRDYALQHSRRLLAKP